MGKEKFVDNNLVKIRGRLMEESKESKSSDDSTPIIKEKTRDRTSSPVTIQDKEWKKAIFKRWDEYKALRRDVILKINETLKTIPEDCDQSQKKISDLKEAESKLKQVLTSIEALDDSGWDRHSLTSELAGALRKVENARMDCMLISSKMGTPNLQTTSQALTQPSNSIIHEIASLSFVQCFKLGFSFSLPLIIGIIIASLIFSLFYYISLH